MKEKEEINFIFNFSMCFILYIFNTCFVPRSTYMITKIPVLTCVTYQITVTQVKNSR